jgi:hypothetical protein
MAPPSTPPSSDPTAAVQVPPRAAPVLARADVVVAGGGPAGLAAALAAARTGATVVLCERYGFLGGNFTAASVGTICGLYLPTGSGYDLVVGGIAREVADALVAEGAGMGPVPFKETAVLLYTPWKAKRLADHLVAAEQRIELLLHGLASDVVVEDGRVVALVLATKAGPRAVVGEVFVDCTGDADLVHHADCPTALGPPGERQFASMQFVLQHADPARAFLGLGQLSSLIAEKGAHLSRDGGALLPTGRPGEFIGAMTRVANPDGTPVDPTDLRELTAGELAGRRLAEEAAEFVVGNVPGFEEAFLQDTACQLGIRESRRTVGDFVLTGADVTGQARFPDAIAAAAWPQEYHTTGRGTEYRFLPPGGYYQIPYRALLPRGPSNLLVAGRCISADHHALASARVMATCMALGQAAGTAAALAARGHGSVAEVDVDELRTALLEAGCFLG